MKITKEIMKQAHKLTKKFKKKDSTIDYKFQLGLCIKFLLTLTKPITKVWNKIKGLFTKKQEPQQEKPVQPTNPTKPTMRMREANYKFNDSILYKHHYKIEKLDINHLEYRIFSSIYWKIVHAGYQQLQNNVVMLKELNSKELDFLNKINIKVEYI